MGRSQQSGNAVKCPIVLIQSIRPLPALSGHGAERQARQKRTGALSWSKGRNAGQSCRCRLRGERLLFQILHLQRKTPGADSIRSRWRATPETECCKPTIKPRSIGKIVASPHIGPEPFAICAFDQIDQLATIGIGKFGLNLASKMTQIKAEPHNLQQLGDIATNKKLAKGQRL